MPLKKYFKDEQKILLRDLESARENKVDALTVYLKDQGNDYIDLVIPYGQAESERYPFDTEKPLEILSDSMGVGIRLSGRFEKFLRNDIIRVRHNNDLQIIHRRVEDRRNAEIQLGYTKGRGKLRSFRKQWEKNVGILKKTTDLANLPKFPVVNANISMTGIGFKIKAPVNVADLCLLFINLDDGRPPVCTLTEVVWRSEDESDGRCMAGFQYLSILDEDKKRIRKFVRTRPAEDAPEAV